jgi:hypothetical protein
VTILVLGYTIAILVVVLSSSKMNADESPLLTTKPPELAVGTDGRVDARTGDVPS